MHTPVLLKEVLEIFDPKAGQTYIDMTVNGGGHARALAERVGERGRVLGIDWDCDLIKESRTRNQELGVSAIELVCDNYANVKKIAKERGIVGADGILFDLGFSSHHVDGSGRGFSFRRDEPLDMRYSPNTNKITAEKIINHASRPTIEHIIRKYGEERYAGRIGAQIVAARRHRRIRMTRDLADIIFRSVPGPYRRGRIHPATRTFQALRIAVNRELENLDFALADASSLLNRGGILIAISFHSLEDGAVKEFFKEKAKEGIMGIIIKKPVRASSSETAINPRSHSARLRAARKII